MKKIVKIAGNWGPIILLTLGTLWVLQGALAKTSSHGVISRGDNYDAGAVKMGSVVKHTIRVFNLSSQPLTVEAQPGCGCTIVDVPNGPISALHTGIIDIAVDTQGMGKGEQRRGVTLQMQSGQQYWQQQAIMRFCLR